MRKAHRTAHRAIWIALALALAGAWLLAADTRARRPAADSPPIRLAEPQGAVR